MKEIPILKANQVDARVQSTSGDKGMIVLLYKDARVDMDILDAVYGSTNWMRHHELIDGQLFCTVSIYDEDKKQWIHKQDVGVESNTQAEKGRASDAFKRACFNLGIGRELYNAPFIFIPFLEDEKANKGKFTKFKVKELEYDKDKQCYTKILIVDQKGNERFKLGKTSTQIPAQAKADKQVEMPTKNESVRGATDKDIAVLVKGEWKLIKDMNETQLNWVLKQQCYAPVHFFAEVKLAQLKAGD